MTNWQKSILSIVFLSLMLAFGYLQTQAPEARSDSAIDLWRFQNMYRLLQLSRTP